MLDLFNKHTPFYTKILGITFQHTLVINTTKIKCFIWRRVVWQGRYQRSRGYCCQNCSAEPLTHLPAVCIFCAEPLRKWVPINLVNFKGTVMTPWLSTGLPLICKRNCAWPIYSFCCVSHDRYIASPKSNSPQCDLVFSHSIYSTLPFP